MKTFRLLKHLIVPVLGVRVFGPSKFGVGIGPIYYTNVQCTGDESALHFCELSTDTDSCEHYEDAGLRCPEGKSDSYLCESIYTCKH